VLLHRRYFISLTFENFALLRALAFINFRWLFRGWPWRHNLSLLFLSSFLRRATPLLSFRITLSLLLLLLCELFLYLLLLLHSQRDRCLSLSWLLPLPNLRQYSFNLCVPVLVNGRSFPLLLVFLLHATVVSLLVLLNVNFVEEKCNCESEANGCKGDSGADTGTDFLGALGGFLKKSERLAFH